MSNIFKNPTLESYSTSRISFTSSYIQNMVKFLKLQNPDISETVILDTVKKISNSRLNRPKITKITFPKYGVSKIIDTDLLTHVNGIGKNIISPSGTIYMPSSKKKSILSDVLEESGERRNKFKKVQLDAAASGDKIKEQTAKLLQASAKIFNNSIPGAMGTVYSFLYDLFGYNAITSAGRQCVKTGYAHTERMLGGILYVTDADSVINMCMNIINNTQQKNTNATLNKYKLYIPTSEDLLVFFNSSLRHFCKVDKHKKTLLVYFNQLSKSQRSVIFYGYCFRNLLDKNTDLMKRYFKKFFDRNIEVNYALDPNAIFKIEEDLLNMALSLNFDLINREADLVKAIHDNKRGVLKLLAICLHMQKCLTDCTDLFATFFKLDIDIPIVWDHNKMVRNCTGISDTDSVIFTTEHIVKWYTGDVTKFDQRSQDINAFSVFIVSQSLEHIFARMSSGIGMDIKNLEQIKMKNEFYYPVLMKTFMRKHYAGIIHVQEGKVLPVPKLDIKGLGLRGSDIPKLTADKFNVFIKWIFDTLITKGTLSKEEILVNIAEHEQFIYKSLMSGQKKFLPLKGIKLPAEYKSDPMTTVYFYYVLWQEVFAPRYGELELPTKAYSIPIIGTKGSVFKNPEWRQKFKDIDPETEKRFTKFIAKYPNKNITSIIIPSTVPKIPEILKDIMDARSIIYKNGRPFFLILRSFNIAIGDKKHKYIASDYVDVPGGKNIPLYI